MARILIIDQDSETLAGLRSMLERQEFDVIEASDTRSGLDAYRESPPDLVITELVMPGKTGLEVLLELQFDFPEVKLIALTGEEPVGNPAWLNIAEQVGAFYVFKKPVPEELLLDAVRRSLAMTM